MWNGLGRERTTTAARDLAAMLIVLLGMQAFSKLVIREYPQMENALITVTTLYAGANDETIQGYIVEQRLPEWVAPRPDEFEGDDEEEEDY